MTNPLQALKDAIDPRYTWANVPMKELIAAVEWMEGAAAKLAVLEETQAELAKERRRAFNAEELVRKQRALALDGLAAGDSELLDDPIERKEESDG